LRLPPKLEVVDRPAKTIGLKAIGAGSPARVAVTQIRAPEPIGWYAALIAFGGMVFSKQIEHVRARGHVSPFLRVKVTQDNPERAGVDDIELHFEDADMLWRTFREPPCPLWWGADAGPLFLAAPFEPYKRNDWGKGYKIEALAAFVGRDNYLGAPGAKYVSPYDMESNIPLSVFWENGGEDLEGHQINDDWGRIETIRRRWTMNNAKGEPIDAWGHKVDTDSEGRDERWPVRWGMATDGTINDTLGALVVPHYKGWTGKVQPAKAVANWLKWRDSVTGRSATLLPSMLGLTLLTPHLENRVKVPAWARKTAAKRAEWSTRLRRWYYRAAFLVWCAECYRAHAEPGKSPSAEWMGHCEAWGIPLRGGKYGRLQDIKKPASDFDIDELLTIVRKTCPVPGSPATLGEQIVEVKQGSPGKAMFSRHLLDPPVEVGSMAAPYRADWISEYLFSEWGKKRVRNSFDIVQTLISIEASFCAAGVGSAVTGIVTQYVVGLGLQVGQQLVLKVVNLAVQATLKLASGADPKELISIGDVVGLFGDACALAGVNAKSISSLTPDVWQAVVQGDSIDGFTGDWLLKGKLEDIAGRLSRIEALGWNHLDAAFGGLGMTGDALEEFGSNLNK
jgi:hypothetical protein